MYRQSLTPIDAVPYPSEKSDVGMCLLQYAYCLSTADSTTFSTSSFDTDRHEGSILGLPSLSASPAVLNRLRLHVLTLVFEVTCKYQSVRKLEDNVNSQASRSNCNITGSRHYDDDMDEVSIVSSSISNLDESSRSDNSDSTFHPVHDDDDEHDNSCRMCDIRPSQEVPLTSNMRPLQDGGNSNGTINIGDVCSVEENVNDDDGDIEEMYSDFKRSGTGCGRDTGVSDDLDDTDNLVCPGDVLEYVTVDGDQEARRSTVDTIIEGGSETCVVLKDGTLLRHKLCSVRKVQFYDGRNQDLIPNPLARWHRLDKCILQSAVNVNCIRPGDLVEYCTVGNREQTVTQSSVDAISEVGKSTACVTLNDGTVLQPNKHSLRKIYLFDEFKQKMILNPLADWYRLDEYMLTPGEITSDDNKEHDEIDKQNQTDMSTANVEQRRKNKQRCVFLYLIYFYKT